MSTNIVNGYGSFLYDKEGKQYINFSESINILGHRNKDIIKIIEGHIKSGMIHYPLTISIPSIAQELTAKLMKIAGIKNGGYVFSSSGSEAVDIAMSIMSEFGPVITVSGGYFGNSGQFLHLERDYYSRYNKQFRIEFPVDSGMDDIEKLIDSGAGGIILEPLQVEGGIREFPNNFIKNIRKNFPDFLICFDESYTGFGKTSDFFAFERHGVVPDLLVVGKAIGGGIPMGLTLISGDLVTKSTIYEKFRNHAFGSTSGNLIALELAKSLIDHVSDPHFLETVKESGKIVSNILRPVYGNRFSGRGLICGVAPLHVEEAGRIAAFLRTMGLMITDMSGILRISPPLNIEPDILIRGCNIIIKNVE